MAYQLKNAYRGESSNSNKVSIVWRKIWDLNVPNVVKVFLWRIVGDVLPTKRNMFIRKLTGGDPCPIDEQAEETSSHMLW